MFRYVAICIAFVLFFRVQLLEEISQEFSKTVVYLTGGFADVKRI